MAGTIIPRTSRAGHRPHAPVKPRYKRAHEVLFGQSMEVAERFNSEQGICLLTKIFEVYQDVHAVALTCCVSLFCFVF